MIDTKHTPGRWYVNVHNGGDYYGNVTADLGMKGGIGQISTIAVILKYPPAEQRAANASLIVAAPAMLEALMEFVSMFPCIPGSIGDEVRQKARAAIAKACDIPIEELGPR